jgi:hypothetical protein
MDLQRQISLLDRAAAIERNAIRTSFKIAVAVFAAGLIGAFLVNRFAPLELGSAKFALTACTGLGSFLSGIPIKDVATKRLKIELLSYLKSEYEYFQTSPAPDPQRLSEVEKRFWTVFDKNI